MKGPLLALITCGAVIGALFFAYERSARGPGDSPSPVVRSMQLDISHGALRGPAEIKVNEGDSVRWLVTSDEADDVHLHGYDLHLALEPGKTKTLTFVAVHTGRFPIELHRADVELAVLEVYPRRD